MQSYIETSQYTNKSITFKVNGKNLDKPTAMGILNITPDSFFDGGKYLNEEIIIQKVNSMEYDGAKIIDIGGYSTRPGAQYVSENEELQRIVPIVKLIKSNFNELLISVDTFRSKVAESCVEVGANIINDVSGGTLDEKMLSCIASLKVPYVLMHIKGTPQNMQENPIYENVVDTIRIYFEEKINKLIQIGVKDIILDPGFGFGKTVDHNYEILNNLDNYKSFGLPLMVGISRKSMINKVINTSPETALNGTTVLNTIALQKGAHILRVHDVKEANETIKLVNKLK